MGSLMALAQLSKFRLLLPSFLSWCYPAFYKKPLASSQAPCKAFTHPDLNVLV